MPRSGQQGSDWWRRWRLSGGFLEAFEPLFLEQTRAWLILKTSSCKKAGGWEVGRAGRDSGCGLVSLAVDLGLVPSPGLASHKSPLETGSSAKLGAF